MRDKKITKSPPFRLGMIKDRILLKVFAGGYKLIYAKTRIFFL
jgi:hypothetical protein